jgi:hypothetical protein
LGRVEAVGAGEEESVARAPEGIEMDRVEQIEEVIVIGCDLHEVHREDLHVTIRIARDFYNFLEKYEETPDAKEIAYMADTIRSGMDQFYLLAQGCRSDVRDSGAWKFAPHEHWDFSSLRETFMHGFEHLADPDVDGAVCLASLFALTHLELVFMARHFPSAIFADWPPLSRTWEETMELMRKMTKERRDRTQGAN